MGDLIRIFRILVNPYFSYVKKYGKIGNHVFLIQGIYCVERRNFVRVLWGSELMAETSRPNRLKEALNEESLFSGRYRG